MSISHFQINLTSPFAQNYGFITLDGNKVFRIADINKFYNALGYTDEYKRIGLTEEEFLWLEYRKDNCKKSLTCLQLKLIAYLNGQFASFKEKYSTQCDYWHNRCEERQLSHAGICVDCPVNSGQK